MTPARKILVSLLLLLLVAQASEAQTVSELKQRVRAAVEAHDWTTASTEADKLRKADETLFRNAGYVYLLGRIAEASGEQAAATWSYETVVDNNRLFADYALWHLAHIARSTGDLVLERERLRRLLSTAPNSLVYDAAALRFSESFFESGDFASAASSARKAAVTKNAAVAREATALAAQSLLRDGKQLEARDVFIKLLMQMPDASRPDDYALTAARGLDELEKATPPSTALSEADHLLRASVYQFNRDFAGARFHYQAVVDKYPQSGTVPNAIYQIARGLYSEGKFDEASKLFQKVVDQYPQSTSARDALGFLASSYVRLKRPDDAVASYKLLIDRFPDAPNPERPYLNIIDTLHEAGRYSDALSWVQQTRTRFKSDIGGTLALFAQLRIHLAQSAWADVIRDADELLKQPDLGGSRIPGGTSTAEINFLRAFALEQQGRAPEAITSYLAIVDGRNEYYGVRATQRLLTMAAADKTRGAIQSRLSSLIGSAKSAASQSQAEPARVAAQSALRLTQDQQQRDELLKIVRNAYASLPAYQLPALQLIQPNPISVADLTVETGNKANRHQSRADDLLAMGLYDEGMPELFAARSLTSGFKGPGNTIPQAQGFSDDAYTLAVYSLRGGLANRAVRFGEQLWRNVPADYVLDVAPRNLVELLYPAPYRESLLRHAPAKGVDPRMVLAIARQESRYQADAKSIAAARGMMQFIPSTANEVAAQLKLSDFNQDDLYYPDTAILFGSQYLSTLFQQFPNQPQAVAGAYNGGADNLQRWIGRARATDPDRYVAEVGFSQTKDYIYKVMANLWNYQRLYDGQLQPQSSAK